MADRYWVGGTGNWSDTNKWSATSGGTGGASVPTSADNVIFDSASNATAYTVTIDPATANCLNMTVSGPAAGIVTIAGSNTLNIYGNLSLPGGAAAITWSATSSIYFYGNIVTVNTNGVTLSTNFLYIYATTSFTLQSAFTISGGILCFLSTGATFSTSASSFAITCGHIQINGAATYNFNSSTVTMNGPNGFGWNVTSTQPTINATNSTFVFSGTGVTASNSTNAQFNGAGKTYGNINISYTGTADETEFKIDGNNTFNGTFTVAGPANPGNKNILFWQSQTFNGAISTTGTAGNRRVVFVGGKRRNLPATLTINSTPTLVDVDFQDIIVKGTAAPLSGTRIGDRRGCQGITFSTPKTVYWNLAAGGNWTSTAWATTVGGAVSTDNHPLAQDQAVFVNTGLNAGTTITFDAGGRYIGSIDLSQRTLSCTISLFNGPIYVHGNISLGTSSASWPANAEVHMVGRRPQTYTTGNVSTSYWGVIHELNSPNGSVEMLSAIRTWGWRMRNGTFDTKGFALTVGWFYNFYNTPAKVKLNNSTVTVLSTSGNIWLFADPFSQSGDTVYDGFDFDAGTSTINFPTLTAAATMLLGRKTYYQIITSADAFDLTVAGGANITNRLEFKGPTTTGIKRVILNDITIDASNGGSIVCSGTTATRVLSIENATTGKQSKIIAPTLTVSAGTHFKDIDFGSTYPKNFSTTADIGDCGGNLNFTGSAPRTLFWNLTGTQNWSATAWSLLPGSTPVAGTFPLPQDTAFIDNNGAATTINFDAAWNLPTINLSERNNAVTFGITATTSPEICGDLILSSAVTWSASAVGITLQGRGSRVISCGGATINTNVNIDAPSSTYTLTSALTMGAAYTLTLLRGTFNADTFNVTAGKFASGTTTALDTLYYRQLYMGSGTWTLSGTGTIWDTTNNVYLWADKGTSNIVVSDNSTSQKSWSSSGATHFNKITLAGTGICTYDFLNVNYFSEIASTKTVAFTITLSAAASQSFGKWSVSGSAGNLVTLTTRTAGSQGILAIQQTTSGIDYLSVSWINHRLLVDLSDQQAFGDFYAGVNSTNGGNNTNVFFTATPTSRTLYWIGGTGTWDTSTTTNWSLSSGGSGGQAPPTYLDDVIFNSASNGTSYTVTMSGIVKCRNLTMNGPASGTLTWASTGATSDLRITGNMTIGSTGISRTHTSRVRFCGIGSRTVDTGSISYGGAQVSFEAYNLASASDAAWTLTSALNNAAGVGVFGGTLNTNGFAVTVSSLDSRRFSVATGDSPREINLGSSTVTLNRASGVGDVISFMYPTSSTSLTGFGLLGRDDLAYYPMKYLTLNAGTSTINITGGGSPLLLGNYTYYNFAFAKNDGVSSTYDIYGSPTFNNLTLDSANASNIRRYYFLQNSTITVNGTFTAFSRSDDATLRIFITTGTIPRRNNVRINAAAVSLRDADFRDVIAGGAATWSGTRISDCSGNQNITFPAPKTVYWNGGTANWVFGWAASPGGAVGNNNLPLGQDTAIINNTSSAGTISVTAAYICGTVDMSGRTNAATLDHTASANYVVGDWIQGTGFTYNFALASPIWFSGDKKQTIITNGAAMNSANVVIAQSSANGFSNGVILQGALTCGGINHYYGIFDANSYNITAQSYFGDWLRSSQSTVFDAQYHKVIAGNSTWTLSFGGGSNTYLTFTSNSYANGSSTARSFYNDFSNCHIIISNTTNNSTVSLFTFGAKVGKVTWSGGSGTGQTLDFRYINKFGEFVYNKSVSGTLLLNLNRVEVDKITLNGSSGQLVNIVAGGTADTFAYGSITKNGIAVSNASYIAVSNGAMLHGDTSKIWYGGTSSVANGGGSGLIASNYTPVKQGTMATFFQ